MTHEFWAGVLFGVIAVVLPSLVVFAVLIKRAPEIRHHHDEGVSDGLVDFTTETMPRHGERS